MCWVGCDQIETKGDSPKARVVGALCREPHVAPLPCLAVLASPTPALPLACQHPIPDRPLSTFVLGMLAAPEETIMQWRRLVPLQIQDVWPWPRSLPPEVISNRLSLLRPRAFRLPPWFQQMTSPFTSQGKQPSQGRFITFRPSWWPSTCTRTLMPHTSSLALPPVKEVSVPA